MIAASYALLADDHGFHGFISLLAFFSSRSARAISRSSWRTPPL
jgi:hypothetical protein